MKNVQSGSSLHNIVSRTKQIKIEKEGVFPDYAEKMSKVLIVYANAKIKNSKVYLNDSKAEADVVGIVDFCILYQSDDGKCSSHTFSYDFTFNDSYPVPSDFSGDISGQFSVSTGSVTCRVMSERKLNLKCELSVSSDVDCNVLWQYYDKGLDGDGDSIETLTKAENVLRVVSSVKRDYSIHEEIKIPKSMPEAESVAFVKGDIIEDNVVKETDRVGFKATLSLLCQYITDMREGFEELYQPIELNESFDADDCAADSICKLNYNITDMKCDVKTDELGENRILDLNVSYSVSAEICENEEHQLCRDIYGIGCDVSAENDTLSHYSYIGSFVENTPINEKCVLSGSDFSDVVSTNSNLELLKINKIDEKFFGDYRLTLSMLLLNKDGEYESKNESVDMRIPLSIPDSAMKMAEGYEVVLSGRGKMRYAEARINGDNIEISGEIVSSGEVLKKSDTSMIVGIEKNDVPKRNHKIVYYYATSEDDAWSIGKRFGVSQSVISENNSKIDGIVKIPV